MVDRDPIFKPERLQSHQSGLRRMISDASGIPYVAFKSLDEARRDPEGIVVFEGDDGGQLYLVARASDVQCGEEALAQLLADVDERAWRDPSAARMFFERRKVGEGISGGMGGGLVSDHVWVHPELQVLREAIEDVIRGRRERVVEPAV